MIHFIEIARAASETAAGENSGGVLGTLGINWKLFVAQLVNFGIILFVLWRWVFKPVASSLQSRTERIENSLKDADRIEKEKQEFAKWRENEMSNARKQASELITQAKVEAGKTRDELLSKTKQEQEKLVEQAKTQITSEKQKALTEAKSEIADLVVTASEKILRKKLDPKNDLQLIKETLDSVKGS